MIRFRELLGLTTREFASVFEFSQSRLNALERNRILGIEIFKRIEIILNFPNVALDYLQLNGGHLIHEKWLKAFTDSGVDPLFYSGRERSLDEILPWSFIDAGISQDFLKREYLRAQTGEETGDCRVGACNTCGLERSELCKAKIR